jgi:ATP adenylyltransferase
MQDAVARGTLWQVLSSTTRDAIACGALHSIETEYVHLTDGGLSFVVRVATSLKRKAAEAKRHASDKTFNPFLPPEPPLTVGRISDTHIAVLNKFNVVGNHLLIITDRFEHQECLLTRADFEAFWRCMQEYPSCGFYNGGAAAGASQAHKHLQLVPLPLYAGQEAFPFESVFRKVPRAEGVQRLPAFEFAHAWAWLPSLQDSDPVDAAGCSLAFYRRLLEETGIDPPTDDDGQRQSAPYNLLMTGDWMLLVPRSREFSHGISLNALAYLGSLFVKDQAALATVRGVGPLSLLREAAVAPG